MAVFIIPTPDAEDLGNFFFDADLDGTIYQLNFEYNERDGFWYFDIIDLEGNEIRTSTKCVTNWPFLVYASSPLKPPGQLMCLDTRENSEEPTITSFGVNIFLSYSDEETIEEVESSLVGTVTSVPLEIILVSRNAGEVLKSSAVGEDVLRSRVVT